MFIMQSIVILLIYLTYITDNCVSASNDVFDMFSDTGSSRTESIGSVNISQRRDHVCTHALRRCKFQTNKCWHLLNKQPCHDNNETVLFLSLFARRLLLRMVANFEFSDDDYFAQVGFEFARTDLNFQWLLTAASRTQLSDLSASDIDRIDHMFANALRVSSSPAYNAIYLIYSKFLDVVHYWLAFVNLFCWQLWFISAVAFFVVYCMRASLSLHRFIGVSAIAFFLLSFAWNARRMYLEAVIKRFHAQEQLSNHCFKSSTQESSIFSTILSYPFSYFTQTSSNTCSEFHRLILIDAIYDVVPVTVISQTLAQFTFRPLYELVEFLQEFYNSHTSGMFSTWTSFICLPLSLVFVLVFIYIVLRVGVDFACVYMFRVRHTQCFDERRYNTPASTHRDSCGCCIRDAGVGRVTMCGQETSVCCAGDGSVRVRPVRSQCVRGAEDYTATLCSHCTPYISAKSVVHCCENTFGNDCTPNLSHSDQLSPSDMSSRVQANIRYRHNPIKCSTEYIQISSCERLQLETDNGQNHQGSEIGSHSIPNYTVRNECGYLSRHIADGSAEKVRCENGSDESRTDFCAATTDDIRSAALCSPSDVFQPILENVNTSHLVDGEVEVVPPSRSFISSQNQSLLSNSSDCVSEEELTDISYLERVRMLVS